MDSKHILIPAVSVVVGLLIGAAMDTWWERPRLARARAELEVLLTAERSQRQDRVKVLAEELARERERAGRLEAVLKTPRK